MKLRYENTPEDMLAFWQHHQRRDAGARQDTIGARVIVAALALLVSGCLLREFAGGIDSHYIDASAAALAALAFFAWPHLVRRGLRRQAAGRQSSWIGEHELEIQPELLIARSPGQELRSQWSHVSHIEADAGRTYLFVTPSSAHVIPAAGVREGDYAAFIEAARERLAAVPRAVAPAAAPAPSAELVWPVFRRIVGLVVLLFGLALAALALLLAWRILSGPWSSGPLIGSGICALIGTFCLLIGYRLIFNRPNSRGTLFGPVVWRSVAALFSIAAIAVTVFTAWKGVHDLYISLPLVLSAGLLAWICWQAAAPRDDGKL